MIAVKPRLTPNVIFSFASLAIATLLVGFALFFLRMSLRDNPQAVMIAASSRSAPVVIGPCTTGPLALRESSRCALALSLERQLVLLAQSMRPDRVRGQRVFCIGVRGTTKEQVLREGEPIYCDVDPHLSAGAQDTVFASTQGEVKMVPQLLDGRSLKLLVEQAGKEAFEIILRAAAPKLSAGMPEPVQLLAQAKWLGQDAFFSKYGGEIYREMGTKHKLLIGSEVLYVSDGGFFSFEKGQWHALDSLQEAKEQALLGAVRFKDQGKLDLEVWDEKGFSIFQTELSREGGSTIVVKPAQLIAEPKRRTDQAVSCKIGKQRWILKPGDWLLSTGSSIRRLEARDEIEGYLAGRIQGELIVIDRFEGGRLSGHVVECNRIKTEPFSIQVASMAKQSGKGRR